MDRTDKPAPRFILGYHAIREYLKTGAPGILHVSIRNKRTEELVAAAERAGIPVRHGDRGGPDLPGAGGHKGPVLELTPAARTEAPSFGGFLSRFRGDTGLVLLLDGVTDTHNFGALLRSADLFRVDAVVVPDRRSAKEDAAAARISSGASAFVSVFSVPNLVRAILALKEAGFWVYGGDMGGDAADRTGLSGRTALALGGEGRGLSRLVMEKCDGLIRIPTAGHVDSFNVSVAGGILLYEIRRQQGFPGFPIPS